MNGIITKEEIKSMIYEIRGMKVILVRDVGFLLEIETKKINQKVKRNIDLFSDVYYFQMNEEEFLIWKSQFVTSHNDKIGLRKSPYVFTMEGISILSTLLKSEKVKEISKLILEVFKEKNEYQIILKSPELQAEDIVPMIYEVRGVQVMLDVDLANIYKCINGTKDINKAVKRNIERFPEDFYFQLTQEEFNALRFQNGTSKTSKGGVRYLPYVFTELGVYTLGTVLKSNRADRIVVSIMRAFVLMKKYISTNLLEQRYINNQVFKNTEDIKILQESLQKFEDKKVLNEIYFNGQIYDAYSKIVDLMNEAKKELIIIDGYADKTVLDMISKLKVKVTLIVKNRGLLSKLDIEKYNKQYNNLEIIYNDTFHDRYLIIDKEKVYHLGASINHIGSKTFSINTIGEESIIKLLIKEVEKCK